MERRNGLHSGSIQMAASSQLGLLPIHSKPATNATQCLYDVQREEQKQQGMDIRGLPWVTFWGKKINIYSLYTAC